MKTNVQEFQQAQKIVCACKIHQGDGKTEENKPTQTTILICCTNS
jgi:hypothetical protein